MYSTLIVLGKKLTSIFCIACISPLTNDIELVIDGIVEIIDKSKSTGSAVVKVISLNILGIIEAIDALFSGVIIPIENYSSSMA